MCWFVEDVVADVRGIGGWSRVRPLGFREMRGAVSVSVAFCLGFLVGAGDMASGGGA